MIIIVLYKIIETFDFKIETFFFFFILNILSFSNYKWSHKKLIKKTLYFRLKKWFRWLSKGERKYNNYLRGGINLWERGGHHVENQKRGHECGRFEREE